MTTTAHENGTRELTVAKSEAHELSFEELDAVSGGDDVQEEQEQQKLEAFLKTVNQVLKEQM
jgi:hypothetical protein